MTKQKDSETAVNNPRTQAGSGTKLTHARSGFDLEDARRRLIATRVKHGSKSAIGRRCSNLIQMMESLPAGPEHRVMYRTKDGVRYERNRLIESIEQQGAELSQLLAFQ